MYGFLFMIVYVIWGIIFHGIIFSLKSCDGVVIPDWLGYQATLSAVDLTDNITKESGLIPPETTYYTFTGVPNDSTYTITLTATNGVGNSLPFNSTIGQYNE